MAFKKNGWLNKNILGFGLASLMSDFGHEMTTAILPSFLVSLVGLTNAPALLGIISGVSDAAASIFKLLSGVLSDRFNARKPFMILGYTLTAVFIALIGTVHTVWQITLYKTLAWLGKGLREPARDAAIAETIAPAYYGRAFGFQRAMDTMGAILGPLCAFFLIQVVALKTIFFLAFIPGILAVFFIIFFTQESKKLEQVSLFKAGFFQQFLILPKRFLFFVVVMFVFGIGNFNRVLLLLYAQEHLVIAKDSFLEISASVIALYTFFNIVRSVSEYSIGYLSDFVDRRLLLAFLGIALFALLSFFMMFHSSSLLFLIFLFTLCGISTAAVTALEKAFAGDLLLTAPHLRATGFGLLQTIDGIGDLVSSVVVGFLWSSIAAWAGFVYAMLVSVLAFILLLLMPKD